MDFKDIKFSELFLDKHGKHLFKGITTIIENEKLDKCDNNYIEVIFKVAFMSYFGLNDQALNRMLEDINCSSDIKTLKSLHKKSIKNIQNHIKSTEIEDLKS